MLTTQTIEELLSVSCVSAIIARSGFAPSVVSKDYGVDLEVRRIGVNGSQRIDLGSFLDLQLKASINWQLTTDHVVYDIEADAYNRLVFRRDNSSIPCALVLCCLPKDATTWISVGEDELVIRKCCYYHFIDGTETKNSSSKRLHIPRRQLLTPDALTGLRDSLYEGALS